MELVKPNYIQTTTGFSVQSNTTAAKYLFNPDLSYQYVSSGYADDNTTTSIVVSFTETLTVSRVALMGINLKEFRLFYNGATANAFAFTSTSATTTSIFTSNSQTAMYFPCTPVACTSVTLDMKKTMVANVEKAIGYFMLSQEILDFPRIPSAKDYRIELSQKSIVHQLSDGNTRLQSIFLRYKAEVRFDHVTTSFRNDLRTVFNRRGGMIFVPFGTSTSWDEVIFPCVWDGPFEFYKFSDDAADAGFSGRLKLLESTP